MFVLLALIAPAFAQDILINEVVYDPAGSDDGFEWVELCNRGSAPIDLTGWTLEKAGTSFEPVSIGGSDSVTSTLDPGAYLVLGYGSLSDAGAFSPNLPNGGSDTDGIRIKDAAGTVMDTLLFDSPNDNALPDDSGAAGTSFASDVTSDHSLARWPDCTDTNDSAVDFVDKAAADVTPGAENAPGGGDTGVDVCENAAEGALIRINEFEPNPNWSDSSDDDAREWVELYNADTLAVDLSGWALQYGTRPTDFDGSTKRFVIPNETFLEPGAFLVIAGDEVPALYELGDDIHVITATEADERDIDMGTASSNADGLRLIDCQAVVVDTVIYGHHDGTDDLERNTDFFLDDTEEVCDSLAPKGSAGNVIGRIEDGVDTDRSYDDFGLMQFPTPGISNTTIPDCPGRDDIKINELVPAPDVSGTTMEWIELYNSGAENIDLSGWGLGGTTSGNPGLYIFNSQTLAPGEYLVIGGSADVPGVDVVDEGISLGNATSNADMVQLVHECGLPADTVYYGPTYLDDEGLPLDDWVDDAGISGVELDDRLAPKTASGESLARCRDGEDTDDNYVDFVVDGAPTPGAANPDTGCEPPVPPACEAGDLSVKINELYPNPAGTDSGNEWVELYNAGSETVTIDAWTLEWGTSSFSSSFSFPGGTEIEPGGFLLVGGTEVPADVTANVSLGNAGTAPDGIRLVDCRADSDPVVQDTVLYADAGEEAEDEELIDDVGGQSMAQMPAEGLTAGRIPDGVDTDDNAVDFSSNLAPTPGYANTADSGGSDDTGTTDTKGCGCGGEKSTDQDKNTDKNCAVVEPSGGFIAGLFLLVAIRRRRRS
jgi:hypothetical protein